MSRADKYGVCAIVLGSILTVVVLGMIFGFEGPWAKKIKGTQIAEKVEMPEPIEGRIAIGTGTTWRLAQGVDDYHEGNTVPCEKCGALILRLEKHVSDRTIWKTYHWGLVSVDGKVETYGPNPNSDKPMKGEVILHFRCGRCMKPKKERR